MKDPRVDLETFRSLTALLYAAALDQARWREFLEAFSFKIAQGNGSFLGHDLKAKISIPLLCTGFAPEFLESYEQHYGAMNVFAEGILKSEIGVACSSDTYLARSSLKKTEFYNDWLLPQEDLSVGGGTVLFKDDHRFFCLGVTYRYRDQEAYEAYYLTLLQMLTPHLQKAIEISRSIESARFQLDTLDGSVAGGTAVFALGARRRLIFSNATGESVLAAGEIARVDFVGRFHFVDPAASAMLARGLRALGGGQHATSLHFPLQDAFGRVRYHCQTATYTPKDYLFDPFDQLFEFREPALLLTVSPLPRDEALMPTLRTTHRLSRAEADIALLLAQGLTPKEIAEVRQTSLHTVRTQVKTVLLKTESRRQSDIVRLVERLRHVIGHTPNG